MELLIHLILRAAQGSPALWPPDVMRARGLRPHAVMPDTAVFDVWQETPGTAWYDMSREAGLAGFDGTSAAFALELDSCYLSWDESDGSLAARLRR